MSLQDDRTVRETEREADLRDVRVSDSAAAGGDAEGVTCPRCCGAGTEMAMTCQCASGYECDCPFPPCAWCNGAGTLPARVADAREAEDLREKGVMGKKKKGGCK